MSTETKQTGRATRHGFWFGIVVGTLSGALVAGAAGSVLASRALGHGFGRAGLENPEAVRERAELAAGFVLNRVDATEQQQAEVQRILGETLENLVLLRDEHRANRQAIHDEFSRADINPDAIEQIRQAEMALADQASRELSEAFTGFAQTLTVEQRVELIEMAERFHKH